MKTTLSKLSQMSLGLLLSFAVQNNSIAAANATVGGTGQVTCQVTMSLTSPGANETHKSQNQFVISQVNGGYEVTVTDKTQVISDGETFDEPETTETFPAAVNLKGKTYTLISNIPDEDDIVNFKLVYPQSGGKTELFFTPDGKKWVNALSGSYKFEVGYSAKFSGKCDYKPA